MGVTTKIDTEIGRRLRRVRLSKDLTQKELSEEIGISFQQIQKYENGTNRVSSTRLLGIANSLGVSITYFFDELGSSDKVVLEENNLPYRVMRVARLLNKLPDGVVKDDIFGLVKAITKAGENHE